MTPQPSAVIPAAAATLRRGGLVAMPTETVYGLAGDALNPSALARIFEVKQRPAFDPLICHAADTAGAEALVSDFPAAARALAEAFWPGPLTLVLPKRARVPDLATSGHPTVAVRVPAHRLARALLREFGGPLAAPSANLFGRLSPTTADAVRRELGGKVDVILDGGPCEVGVESTIIGFGPDGPRLLRAGGVPLEEIEAVAGPVAPAPGPTARPEAPGMLASHYAPRTPLRLENDGAPAEHGPDIGWLLFGPTGSFTPDHALNLSPAGDLREAAARLFQALRELDEDPAVRLICARPVPERGLGRAINDRLRRAAA
ncbi:MAG: L-threonylcarbamoyladenylate synthase [Verrucomicrobiota bacterium]